MSTPAQPPLPGDPTRERLKTAAQHLFAERGIDGVSIRDIVAAAGARNGASIHYYFRTKEALIQELVLEGAQRIDIRRNAALDALERDGGPRSVAEIARLLVETSIEHDDGAAPRAARVSSYVRFINAVQVNHRQLFLDALQNRWNSGYQRCLRHLERLLAGIPPEVLNQRFIFMSLYLGSTMAARENALEHPARSSRLWRTAWAVDNLVDSLCGLLGQPPSEDTARTVPKTALRKRG
ncbi:MAG TPA: helix-turn-helix domain-containing protein [Quisquiliibacterium sp.]|nr:helix-turn-helix domain-containing protein [Quisquiliibacterium sp.]